ncbi:MAG: hypothetical protein ABJA79_07275 [Parafilimonas sp.]
MQTVNGIYDGKKIKLLQQAPVQKPCKVIVTFVDEEEEETESFRNHISDEDAFNFWKAKEEDIYQDYLKNK